MNTICLSNLTRSRAERNKGRNKITDINFFVELSQLVEGDTFKKFDEFLTSFHVILFAMFMRQTM